MHTYRLVSNPCLNELRHCNTQLAIAAGKDPDEADDGLWKNGNLQQKEQEEQVCSLVVAKCGRDVNCTLGRI